jgi:hypothetical protein
MGGAGHLSGSTGGGGGAGNPAMLGSGFEFLGASTSSRHGHGGTFSPPGGAGNAGGGSAARGSIFSRRPTNASVFGGGTVAGGSRRQSLALAPTLASHRGSFQQLPGLRPNLVSVISVSRGHRDAEGARAEKELQRLECAHDELTLAIDTAYEQYMAIKGLPPNAYHAGHDSTLSFIDVAFLFEKVRSLLDS